MKMTSLKGTLTFGILAAVLPLHAQTVFDATADFSITNGNPNGVWSYGWMPTDLNAYHLFANNEGRLDLGWGVLLYGWYGWGDDASPHILRDLGSGIHPYVPAGWLTLHPGPGGEPAVLRWVAPFAGLAHIRGRFLAGDSGIMQVVVRKTEIVLWQAVDSGEFDLLEGVSMGDTFDFAVYGGYGCGNTPLEANITLNSSTNQPPSIWTQPLGQTNFVGDTFQLTVVAGGNWPFSYVWRKDGVNLDGATDSTLVLSNATVAATGDYTVVVANDFGSVTSAVARVELIAMPRDSLTKGLVGYWSFDEGGGTHIADQSGTGNNGTLFGAAPTAMWTQGHTGTALYFDGESGACVAVASSQSLQNFTSMTFAAWVRCDDTDRDATILSKEQWHGRSYWFGCVGGVFGVWLGWDGGWVIGDRDNGLIIRGQWTHLVSVWDGATLKHYQNGNYLGRDASFHGPLWVDDTFLAIGNNSVLDFARFKGAIDEVRIYNRPLSGTEVKALYAYDGSQAYQPTVSTELVQRGAWSPATNSFIHKVVASGNRVLAIAGDSDVYLLDLGNPAAPVVLGSWTTLLPLSGVVLVGNVAYLASWEMDFLSTVEIVDFTDPARPVLRGFYDTPGYAMDLAVRGNIAYVADAEGGLLTLNVEDPSWPWRLGGYDTMGSLQGVEVSGRYAYISDGKWLVTLDVSDPAVPRRVGLYQVAGGISSLKAYGTKLYVSEGTGDLRVLDVSNPASIRLLGAYRGWGNSAQAMAVSGQFMYLAKGIGGLHVVEVSDPAKPTWLTSQWAAPAEDVALMGNYALVAGGDKGLMIYELQQHLYPPLPAPVISGGTMTLTWATTNDFRLQKTTNLVDAIWLDVPESEGTNMLTLPMTEPTAFFRLVKGPKVGQPIPPPPGMVAWWSGDGNALDLVGAKDGSLQGGVTFGPGEVGEAFHFQGGDDMVLNPEPALLDIRGTFTMEFWAFPDGFRLSTPETTDGMTGYGSQRYAIHPDHGAGAGDASAAGAGVSVGVNGISVFEHSVNYIPSLLVYDAPISNWTHVAVVYEDNQPRLYVNGKLVRTGLRSLRTFVFPSKQFSCSVKGPYSGLLDEVSIYNRALTAEEIKAICDAGSAGKVKPPR